MIRSFCGNIRRFSRVFTGEVAQMHMQQRQLLRHSEGRRVGAGMQVVGHDTLQDTQTVFPKNVLGGPMVSYSLG
jgi:hypothetical protein